MVKCGTRSIVVAVLAVQVCTLLILFLSAGVAGAANTVLFSDDFETALTGWTTSGKAVWSTTSPVIGTHDIQLSKRSSIQRTVSTLGWQDITVSFWLGATLKRSGSTLDALWFDGATWTVLQQIHRKDADADGALHSYQYALPAAAANNSKFAIRFRLNSNFPGDSSYVDNVTVSAGGRYLYTLSLSGDAGSVEVDGTAQTLPWSGTFEYGSTVALHAVGDTGYHFTGWSGALTSSVNPTTILIDGNRNVTANFAIDQYTLSISSGTGNGSVTVDGVPQTLPWSGVYDRGTQVVLQAVPVSGYRFTGWAGALTGTTSPVSITMEGDKAISAGFGRNEYVLLLSGIGDGGVQVDGVYHALPDSISVSHGTTVTLTAMPGTGSHFTGWSGDLTGEVTPTSFTMDSDKSVTAGFALGQFTLNLFRTGAGSGVVRVDGVDHAIPWSGTFHYGDTPTLLAVPAAGSHFESWSGHVTGAVSPVFVVMDSDKDITAGFGLDIWTLAITGTNGTVTLNGIPKILPWSGMFGAGEVVELEGVPIEGYHFVSWSGDLTSSSNPAVITMDKDKAVAAEFSALVHTLTVTGANGSLNVDGVAQTLPYSASYDYGAVVTLEAVPDAGYRFNGWSGALTGTTNPSDIIIVSDATVAANFGTGSYTLSLSGTGGTVTVDGVAQTLPWSGQYSYGANVTLAAVADSCMRFQDWSGDLVAEDNPVVLTINSDTSIAASFTSVVVFSDVDCSFWAVREIAACFFEGVVTGYPDGAYKPSVGVTRDQMAVYISRALAGGDAAVPTGPAQASFPDVPVDHWAFKYIEFARSQQIVEGYPDGTYKPEVALDRGQMAVFIARAIATPTDRPGLTSYTPPPTPTFSDVPTSFWSARFIEYIAQPTVGVAHGYPDGVYRPEYACTRDQMAVYVARAFGLPL
jgi:uncharacterized repeat protein (TIGR02543 family)